MHIGFIENGYPLDGRGGGAGTYVTIMARELVRLGHSVTVIAPRVEPLPAEVAQSGLTVVRPGMGGRRHYYVGRTPVLRCLRHVARFLEYGRSVARVVDEIHRERPFDLVEYSEGGDFWHGECRDFRMISHLHGSRYTFLRQSGRRVTNADWWHRRLELRFVRKADWVFSPALETLRIVEREAGVPLIRSTVLPYPIDPEQCGASSVSCEKGNSPVRIMFAARNDPVKGADLLLEAAEQLVNCGRSLELELFGFSPAPGQVLPSWVVVNPFMPRHELLKEYARMDICVIPSFWDNSPNTVYEAMAAGKPVVASAVGGIPEIVADGVTGLLVRPGNRDELVTALVRLIDSAELRRSMGLAGRERIQLVAEPTSNCEERIRVYEDLVGCADSVQGGAQLSKE